MNNEHSAGAEVQSHETTSSNTFGSTNRGEVSWKMYTAPAVCLLLVATGWWVFSLHQKLDRLAKAHDNLVNISKAEFCTLGSVEQRIGQLVTIGTTTNDKGEIVKVTLDQWIDTNLNCQEFFKITK